MVNQVVFAEVQEKHDRKTGGFVPVISPIETEYGINTPLPEPRAGSECPECQEGTIDYDGMLNLTCDHCGYSLVGCFT